MQDNVATKRTIQSNKLAVDRKSNFSMLRTPFSIVGVLLNGLYQWLTRCHLTCSVRTPAQAEDEPIGWFELEEDWNDVEIKLQQCRVAKVHTASR